MPKGPRHVRLDKDVAPASPIYPRPDYLAARARVDTLASKAHSKEGPELLVMDALRNLTGNVPEWQRKLDQLNGEIDNRQIELAALHNQSKPRSLRPRGSTESLKPKDEPAAFPDEEPMALDGVPDKSPIGDKDQQDRRPEQSQLDQPRQEEAIFDQQAQRPAEAGPAPSSGRLQTASAVALQRQTHQALAVAQAKARAVVKRKQRTESMMSRPEGAPPKYRTRFMIIVYYDSYVQTFFEELVKFVSASRNLMRKAKMAARVAMIKRMAELEFPEEDNDDGNGGANSNDGPRLYPPDRAMPPLAMVGSRYGGSHYQSPYQIGGHRIMMGSYGGPGPSATAQGTEEVSIWDKLDKVLESVQSMCEHAAHNFLREGDCSEDISNMRQKLGEARDLADKELERASKEGLGALQEEAASNPRKHLKIHMRKPKEALTKDDAPADRNDASDPAASLIVDTAVSGAPAPAANATANTTMPMEIATAAASESVKSLQPLVLVPEQPALEPEVSAALAAPNSASHKEEDVLVAG